MALNTQITDAIANAQCAIVTALCNGGTINLYSGTQPANANTAVGVGNTLLATLTFNGTAFGSPTAGVATANAITSGTAVATGTATWFRVLKSDGVTVVYDGSVGTSGCNLNLNSNAIQINATVSITSLTFSALEAGS
jgi:hypothetical protein